MNRFGPLLQLAAFGLASILCLPMKTAGQNGPVRVEVRGVEGELRRNVMAVLSLARVAGSELVPEARVRRLHDRAPREIRMALEPFGRYEPSVESTVAWNGRRWRATYLIDPGPPILLSRADVRVLGPGESETFFQEALRGTPLSVGEPLSHQQYELAKTRLESVAVGNGYLDAAFDSSLVRIDRAQRSAEIVLHLQTGPRFSFGPVTFVQDALEPELLQAMVPFRPGDPFDAQQLLLLQTALTAGPYFAGVEIVPRRELAEELRVPLEVQLILHRPQRYLLGGGYGTDTGPRGTLETEIRRLNRRGHRADGQARVSLIERRVSTRYSLPLRGTGGLLSFSAGFVDSNPSTSDTETFLLGANLARLMGSWKQDLSASLQHATYDVGADDGVSTLLVWGMGLSQVRADDRIYPTWGHHLGLRIRGSHEALLSDTRFLQVGVEGKVVRSLGSRVRFLARGEAGTLLSNRFRTLPASFRYFTGGDRSIRGFTYQSLGPRDEEEEVSGGTRLLVASAEMDFRVLDAWSVAGFVDVGNALRRFSGSLERSVGMGLRWRSPIGPIRLDGAFALSARGTPFRLHLNIGPEL